MLRASADGAAALAMHSSEMLSAGAAELAATVRPMAAPLARHMLPTALPNAATATLLQPTLAVQSTAASPPPSWRSHEDLLHVWGDAIGTSRAAEVAAAAAEELSGHTTFNSLAVPHQPIQSSLSHLLGSASHQPMSHHLSAAGAAQCGRTVAGAVGERVRQAKLAEQMQQPGALQGVGQLEGLATGEARCRKRPFDGSVQQPQVGLALP